MSADKASEPAKSRARGLERAFSIIDYLYSTKEPQRPIDIAIGMNAPKSSVYELIGLLTAAGILERVDKQGRVFLGRKLHFWGLAYLKNFDLTRLAEPLLKSITEQTRETSQLCMLDGNKYTVVMMNEGNRQFRISSDVGERIPIPWTASGRLLLGHLSDDEILSLIADEEFELPDGNRLDPHQYIQSVRGAWNDKFYSFDSLADNYTHCFAAPVIDLELTCLCTLCIIAPKEDAKRNYDTYRAVLVQAAQELSELLNNGPVYGGVAAE